MRTQSQEPIEEDPAAAALAVRYASKRIRRHITPQRVIVLALGFGGIFGALARYGIQQAIPTATNGFPWSTFLINITGSAFLGFLLITLLEQFPGARLARPVIGTGFTGAYTTFSTFSVEAVTLTKAGHAETAAAYVVASLLAGLVAVWLGMVGARSVLRAERWLQEQP